MTRVTRLIAVLALLAGGSAGAIESSPLISTSTVYSVSATTAQSPAAVSRVANPSATTLHGHPAAGATAPGEPFDSGASRPRSGRVEGPPTAATANVLVTGPAESPRPVPSLEPVHVVASRPSSALEHIPAAVSIIDARDASASGASPRTGDALVNSGAASFMSKYPAALDYIAIRGYKNTGDADSAQVAVLVDGRPAGGANLAKFPLDGLDRVEVVRGAGSALFGSSAMGGVVNLVPKRGRGEPSGAVALEAGSWDHRKLRGEFGGEADAVDFFATASRLTSGPFQVPGDGYRNAGTEEWNGALNMGVSAGPHRIGVSTYGWFGDVLHDPGMLSWPVDSRQYAMKRYLTGEVSLAGSQGWLSWDQALYQTRETDVYHEYSSGPESVSHFEGNEEGGRHLFTANLGRESAVTTGLEWANHSSENFNYTDVPYSPRAERDNMALLAEARVQGPWRPLELTGGVRQDWFTQKASQPEKGLAIPGVELGSQSWDATTVHGGLLLDYSVVRFYASAGTGFRAPVAAELAANFSTSYYGNTWNYRGNPDLAPEHSLTAEGGVGMKLGALDGRVGYFRTVFTDKISQVLTGGNDYTYRNLKGTTVGGVELEASTSVPAKEGTVVRPFVSGTWHDIRRNDDLDEVDRTGVDTVLYIPEWFGSAGFGLERDPGRPGGWSGRVAAVAQGRQWEQDFSTGGYGRKRPFVVFNADARYRLSTFASVYAVVQNFMNEEYEYHIDYPEPGTTVVTGLEVSF